MAQPSRKTVMFEPQVLAALEDRAVELHCSLSEMVNDLLRQALLDRDREAEDRSDYELGVKRYLAGGRRWTLADMEEAFGLGD